MKRRVQIAKQIILQMTVTYRMSYPPRIHGTTSWEGALSPNYSSMSERHMKAMVTAKVEIWRRVEFLFDF